MKQVEGRLPSQNVSTVLVIFLGIWSASVAKKIIDTQIYDNDFDYFVEPVLEVCKKIYQKRAPYVCAT